MFKELGALLVVSSMVIWWVWKHNKWLAAMLAWLVIRMILPPTQTRGMITLTNVFMAVMTYLAIQYISIDLKKIYKAIAITLFIQITTVFLQSVNMFFCWNAMSSGTRVWGLFGNSNWSGCYIAMTIPISMWLAREDKRYYLGILGIPALVIMKSQFALLAGIAGVLFYLYATNRDFILKSRVGIAIFLSVISLTAILCVKPLYFDDGGRFNIWDRIIKLSSVNPSTHNDIANQGEDPAFQSHFVQGWGVGEAYNILPLIQSKILTMQRDKWRQAHNEPIQILLEYGAIGLVLFIGLVISTLRKTCYSNSFLMACLVALIVDSFGFFPFRISPIGYLGMIYLAIIDRGHNAILRNG
jgi:hypothetical protein